MMPDFDDVDGGESPKHRADPDTAKYWSSGRIEEPSTPETNDDDSV